MKLKAFLTESRDIDRASYFWNMLGNMLFALQSVVLLMILTRTVGLEEAGIFTLAFSSANLFLTIGKYGMRAFMVSDLKQQFTFGEYVRSRVLTTLAMLAVSLVYVLVAGEKNDYSFEKSLIIFFMCCFKAVDAAEDVVYGLFQRNGRLDIAAKIMSLRMVVTILVFGVCTFVTHSLLVSLVISTFVTAAVFVYTTALTRDLWKNEDRTVGKGKVSLLLKLCFPLFAGVFLSTYITNAPKFAIDAALSDEIQACYGFIAMPVFVINLLNGFIFNPLLYRMSMRWKDKRYKAFAWMTVRQMLIIMAIASVCMAGAYAIGTPVLSWLYNTDLTSYRKELVLLLLGGGLLCLTGLLSTVITIIRFQKYIVWGYLAVAAAAWLSADKVVAVYGITGAVLLYDALMAALCITFGLLLVVGIHKMRETQPAER